jgi:prenyltransferase beta subunit
VGAIGMLASNMVLGQGPYTPWQMAAWGLVGLAGAALARLGNRHLGRLALALACALAALGAKEIMNLYTWTIGAPHTPAALLADVLAGLPFDLVDVVASFLFGLAFAPELARLLTRVRTRMDVRWEAVEGAALPIAAIALVSVMALLAAPPGVGVADALRVGIVDSPQVDIMRASRASDASLQLSPEIGFLAHAQNADGGFGAAPGQASSELYSAWAAIGLAAAGRNPLSLARRGHTVLSALYKESSKLEDLGDIERTMLALHACGVPAASLGPRDLLGELLRGRGGDGSFEHLVNITTFAIFALRDAKDPAAGATVRAAGAWIARQQNDDGGFSFGERGGTSDVDDTAAALQALVDAGVRGGVIAHAVNFLTGAQNPDGGFPQERGGESNAQSTAWAVQGLVAAGRSVAAVRRDGSRSPLGYLQSLVAPNGSVRYSRTSAQAPVWVTAQALTALAGKPF